MENFGNLQQQGLLLSLDLEANEVWKGDNWTSFFVMTWSSGKFPELEEYFPIIFNFEKLDDALNQI